MTGAWKLLAAAGWTSIITSIASGSLTFIVIVVGMRSEFLRISSVQRPTVSEPPSAVAKIWVRTAGVPPSEGGGSSGIGMTAAAPAPGAADSPVEGATGLREQPVRKIATVVRRTAERRER